MSVFLFHFELSLSQFFYFFLTCLSFHQFWIFQPKILTSNFYPGQSVWSTDQDTLHSVLYLCNNACGKLKNLNLNCHQLFDYFIWDGLASATNCKNMPLMQEIKVVTTLMLLNWWCSSDDLVLFQLCIGSINTQLQHFQTTSGR